MTLLIAGLKPAGAGVMAQRNKANPVPGGVGFCQCQTKRPNTGLKSGVHRFVLLGEPHAEAANQTVRGLAMPP